MADTGKVVVEVVGGTNPRSGAEYQTVKVTVPGNRSAITVSSVAKLDALLACGFDGKLADRVRKALAALPEKAKVEGTSKRKVVGTF